MWNGGIECECKIRIENNAIVLGKERCMQFGKDEEVDGCDDVK